MTPCRAGGTGVATPMLPPQALLLASYDFYFYFFAGSTLTASTRV